MQYYTFNGLGCDIPWNGPHTYMPTFDVSIPAINFTITLARTTKWDGPSRSPWDGSLVRHPINAYYVKGPPKPDYNLDEPIFLGDVDLKSLEVNFGQWNNLKYHSQENTYGIGYKVTFGTPATGNGEPDNINCELNINFILNRSQDQKGFFHVTNLTSGYSSFEKPDKNCAEFIYDDKKVNLIGKKEKYQHFLSIKGISSDNFVYQQNDSNCKVCKDGYEFKEKEDYFLSDYIRCKQKPIVTTTQQEWNTDSNNYQGLAIRISGVHPICLFVVTILTYTIF
eukprot:Pgem_evm1s4764